MVFSCPAAPYGFYQNFSAMDAVFGSICFTKDQLRIDVQVVLAIFTPLRCVR
jgi:sulfur relay (sulfurtransferase) DsrF/TusC family protein